MLTLGSPLESFSTNGAPRVYNCEYTWQQTVPLTQLKLSMQARDLERMSIVSIEVGPSDRQVGVYKIKVGEYNILAGVRNI